MNDVKPLNEDLQKYKTYYNYFRRTTFLKENIINLFSEIVEMKTTPEEKVEKLKKRLFEYYSATIPLRGMLKQEHLPD